MSDGTSSEAAESVDFLWCSMLPPGPSFSPVKASPPSESDPFSTSSSLSTLSDEHCRLLECLLRGLMRNILGMIEHETHTEKFENCAS